MRRLIVALLMSVVPAIPAPALAQEPPSAPACAAVNDAGLPPALAAAWSSRAALLAAGAVADIGQANLPIGMGVDARLKKAGEVTFPVPPSKPGGPETYGGLIEVRIAEPGDYQVSLGAGAWIEVVSGKTLLASTAHAPGAACSSLKKTVVFPLTPGSYVLEITGSGQPTLAVMVTRAVK